MTINMNIDPAIGVTKNEFKIIYKSMKTLVAKLDKYLRSSFEGRCWSAKEDRPAISIDMPTFKQAWNTVQLGKCPIYTTIHIHATKRSETYLALENFIATKLSSFCIANNYRRVDSTFFTNGKPIGKRKDRFRSTGSVIYSWFGIYARGKMDPTNNNFRIVIKSEHIFRDADNSTVLSYLQ